MRKTLQVETHGEYKLLHYVYSCQNLAAISFPLPLLGFPGKIFQLFYTATNDNY